MTICFFGTYDPKFSQNKIVRDGLRVNGVKVEEVNAYIPLTRMDKPEHAGFLSMLRRILKKKKLIAKIVRRWRTVASCDVIYVGYPGHFDVVPALVLAKLLRKKLVFYPLLVLRALFIDDFGLFSRDSIKGRLLFLFESFVYRFSDRVIADTPLQKTYMAKTFGVPEKKIAVIPIGADDAIYTKAQRAKSDSSVFRVLYYGMYTPLHGMEHIIRAAELSRKDERIRYILVGNGATFDETVAKVKKLGLTNVDFYPDMTEKTAIPTLQTADVFLGFLQKHPTVDRTIPNKVFQGLALEKAVITAQSAAITQYFTHKKDVYMVRPASGEALLEAIHDLRDNPALKESIARNGYERFKASFTPQMMGKQLRTVMEELLA